MIYGRKELNKKSYMIIVIWRMKMRFNMIKKNLFTIILKRVLLCLNKIEFCNNT